MIEELRATGNIVIADVFVDTNVLVYGQEFDGLCVVDPFRHGPETIDSTRQ